MEYREIYHANRYHAEYPTLMTCVTGVGHVFLRDFVILSYHIGDTIGKVLKFFKKASDYILPVEPLLKGHFGTA